jgi:hypothetical protein
MIACSTLPEAEAPVYGRATIDMSATESRKTEIGGPTQAPWQEEALARIEGLHFLKQWVGGPDNGCDASIDAHLAAAHDAAIESRSGRFSRTRARAGSPFERALANLDMAEVDLLRLAEAPVLEGALPSVQAHVNRFLAKDDPRRMALDAPAKDGDSFSEAVLRERVLNALYAANTQRRRNLARVQSFAKMLRAGIVTGIVLAVVLGVIGLVWPQAIPLCFTPEADGQVALVCPQGTVPLGGAPLDPQANVAGETSATV